MVIVYGNPYGNLYGEPMAHGRVTKKNHKPPSRGRYEESHPAVSFRVQRSLYNDLKTFLSQRGMSFADFVKEAMGVQQAAIREADSARLEAYQRGYQMGKRDAKRELNRAMTSEVAAVRAEKEQAVKEARDAMYKEGYRKGCLDEKNKSEKTLNDEIVRLEAKKEEALKRVRDEGWREGHAEGYKEAKDKYLVSCDCALCGRTIEVVTEEQKNIIRELVRQYHLAHGDCEAKEKERRQAEEAERLKREAQRGELRDRYGTRAVERGFD